MEFLIEIYNIIVSCFSFMWTTFQSSEGISTLLIVLILSLKLYINNQATILQKKTLFVSIPGEITVLIIGFILSAAISDNPDKNYMAIITLVIVSLILLTFLFVSERSLEGSLSGTWSWKVWLRIVLMYIFAIALYIHVVFGGVIL